MTVNEFIKVLSKDQFIAVANKDGNISYSGSVKSFKSFLANSEVSDVVLPDRPSAALIIHTR